MLTRVTEPEEGSKTDRRRYETSEPIGRAGLIVIVLGVLLAMIQANTTSSNSSLWVTIFIGIALVGVGLRIEAAIRARSRR
jgi:UDP-N-acetylmuramyl pentapeptide phosphotransferase/UDP-N-acetylglucosamine-1-phosphate transferase